MRQLTIPGTNIAAKMAIAETLTETVSAPKRHKRADFLDLLFRSLDSAGIRYCVLHSWEELPQNLQSDLDLAVHPADISRLPGVLVDLRRNGYRPLHIVNYAIRECRFDFVWFEGQEMDSVAVDITHGYVEGGLILMSGPDLVAKRRRRKSFWVADAATEFAYLLARITLKESLPARHEERLRWLTGEIGSPQAEELAGRLFGERCKATATKACLNGSLRELLPKLKTQLWRTVLRHDPLNPIRHLLSNSVRLIRRWLQPNGIVILFLGPDGVGKTTLINHVSQLLSPAFRGHRMFHYRPALLWRRRYIGDATDPHGSSQHSVGRSLARLLVHIADYWASYWLIVRPMLTRSGLVLFDRYFYDLAIDPKRYRYGAPLWVARILRPLIPKPDLLFVLDAPTQVVLSRKQEVVSAEIERQREIYLREAKMLPHARLIDTSASVAEAASQIAKAVVEYSDYRLQQRRSRWTSSHTPLEQPQDLRNLPTG